jgi:hypothetical protein
MCTIRALAVALLALSLNGPGSEAMAQRGCISGQEGRQLMESGQVVPFPEAARRAGLSSDQVVEVQLCQAGGGFVYRVRVLQPGGKVRGMTIPAN